MAQIYEKYWKYTAAYTDLNSEEAFNAIKLIIKFIDKNRKSEYSPEKYANLQSELQKRLRTSRPSIRKAINQYVKLGFVFPKLMGYPHETKEYIKAETNEKRNSLMSKIVYKYAKFNSSISKDSQEKQINFLLKTLEETGYISKEYLTALMTIDISKVPKGFLTEKELKKCYNRAEKKGFKERKYNQISHLMNLLGKLDDLVVNNGSIYFKTETNLVFGDNHENRKSARDPYLQRIYKFYLIEESNRHFGTKKPRCMIEGLSYPVLIASHIKPYRYCSLEEEKFDINNGLLLSKNLDSLFDLGYITFDNNGIILASSNLENELIENLRKFRLHRDFINPQRVKYIEYHRKNIFKE